MSTSEPLSASSHDAAKKRNTRRAALIAALSAVAVTVASAVPYRRQRSLVRLATGVRDGTFFALGNALSPTIQAGAPEVRVELLATGGSVENLEMLKSGRAEMAFASSAVPAVEGVSLVCPLGDEIAHLIVRKSLEIRSPSDLRGRSVSVGPERSGTRFAALSVLSHFGLDTNSVRALALSPNAAKAAFERGEADARTKADRRSVCEAADALRTKVFDQLVAGNFVADDAFRLLVLRLDALIARNDDVPGMALAPVSLQAEAEK